MSDPFQITPLLMRMIKFEQIAADFNRLNGDSISELEQLQLLLAEIKPLLESDSTFRARREVTRQKIQDEEEKVRNRGLGRVLSAAEANRDTANATFAAKVVTPELRPWEDVKVIQAG